MLHEAQCRVAEQVWMQLWSRYSHSVRTETWKRQVTGATHMWNTKWHTDGRPQVTTDKHAEIRIRHSRRKCWERHSHILTSALSISATIFKALLALFLHTNSMGLVSASHTSEATIQSSRSPERTHKHTHTLKLGRHSLSSLSQVH